MHWHLASPRQQSDIDYGSGVMEKEPLIWMTHPFSVTSLPFYHFKLSDERSGGAGAGVAQQREKYSLIYQTNSSRHFSK